MALPKTRRMSVSILVVAALMASAPAWAVAPKRPGSTLEEKAFFKPELSISSASIPLDDVKDQLENRAAWEGFLRQRTGYASDVKVFLDPRSGAVVNIVGAFPLLPGNGVGNQVTLAGLGSTAGPFMGR